MGVALHGSRYHLSPRNIFGEVEGGSSATAFESHPSAGGS